MTTTAYPSTSSLATPAALLAGLRADRATADAAEARILAGAVAWAEAHPATDSGDAAAHWEHGVGVPIAGDGTPLVAEWCVAEFAAALGLSTDAGRTLMGHAVELRHRLPRVWARVQAGDLQAWRARRIADHTTTLSAECAGFVDRHVAPVAHKVGPAQTQRLVDEAIARFDPDQVVETAETSADRRHVTIHRDQISFNGTLHVEADLDIADAHDLDTALANRAAVLKDLGCTQSLDVRRSLALGDLARTQLGLTFDNTPGEQTKTRQVVLHVHLSETALTGSNLGAPRVGAARTRRQAASRVRAVRRRPFAGGVKRLGRGARHRRATNSGDRARDAPPQRPRTAEVGSPAPETPAFPWCTRNARSCDLDHVDPYARGGPTATDNLAPLCRRHHRLKTFAGWTYTILEPGTYLWRSPHGLAYQRDHQGTVPLDPVQPWPPDE